jgi:hypothetical protein
MIGTYAGECGRVSVEKPRRGRSHRVPDRTLIEKKMQSLKSSYAEPKPLGKRELINQLTGQMIRMQIELHNIAIMQIELVRRQIRIEMLRTGRSSGDPIRFKLPEAAQTTRRFASH